MRLIDGAMQDYALTLDRMIEHAARWHPEKDVVTRNFDGSLSRASYADIHVRARTISSVLQGIGVGRGDRVATLAWNTQAHMECWYGIMGMGAICHTLNPRLTAAQLAWMVGQSEARILIVSGDLLLLAAGIREECGTLEHILVIDPDRQESCADSDVPGVEYVETMLSQSVSGDVVWGDFPETSPCGLCFTSGTTGKPKGVTYTHRGSFLHTLRQLQADVTGLNSHDVVMPVVPMFHANAWGLPYSAPATGARLVFCGRQSDGETLADLIIGEGVTVAVGVPTVWLSLFDHLDANDLEVPSLKRIMVGGAPMNAALMSRIEARGIAVQTTWGMTELSPLGTAAPPGDDRSPETAGRPALGVDLMLADHEGTPLPQQRQQEGHLWVRGPSVVERYFGQTEAATRGGWFPTGDLAQISQDGQLFITGRAKDLIKSGGEWINPAEIEAIVSGLAEVAFAAVIGREHEKWGERPLLLVQFRNGDELDREELIGALRGRVPTWWLPDEVMRIETMPLAATGKIDKLLLRKHYGTAGAEA